MLDEARKEAYTACMADVEDMFKIEALVYVPDLLFRKYEMSKYIMSTSWFMIESTCALHVI